MRSRNLFSVLGAARCVAAGFLGAVALAGGAWAVPPTVNVHGQLLDGDGQALTGTRAYRIRFYDASTGGAQLGGDVAGTAALSSKGLFNLSIVPPAAALASPTLFYEAAVDSSPTPNGVDAADVFPERVKVESVPFALEAETVTQVDADRVGGGMVSNGEFAHLDGVSGALQPQIDAKADAAAVAVSQAAQDAIIAQKLTFAWGEETGTAVQAAPNRGYVCTNAAQAVVTLPPTASLSVGDVVRVSAGTGGWRIAQNAGQQVTLTSPGPDSTALRSWVPRGISANWSGVASSSDGMKLVAVAPGQFIQTSTDGGETWVSRDAARNWTSVASSSDGTKLVASVYGGQIYTSTTSGGAWTARDSNRNWQGGRFFQRRDKAGCGGEWWPALYLYKFRRHLDRPRQQPQLVCGGLFQRWDQAGSGGQQWRALYIDQFRCDMDSTWQFCILVWRCILGRWYATCRSEY